MPAPLLAAALHAHARALAFSWNDLFQGTEAAPWLWWLAALVVLIAALLLGMRMLGLFPE